MATDQRDSPNRDVLLAVAEQISPLLEEVVFVGGQVAELLITAPEAEHVRPTDDVDIVVPAATKLEYREVERRLTLLGLRPDSSEGAPICRWLTSHGFKIDVMPRDKGVLGFGSRWYDAVVTRSSPFRLTDNLTIRIPPAPLYLATKWDAFDGRGRDDHWRSHDLEDIITVVAGRAELLEETANSDDELREWLASKARAFLDHPDCDYALHGALADARHIPGLVATVRRRFEEIAARAG
jgi:hypothetical protein